MSGAIYGSHFDRREVSFILSDLVAEWHDTEDEKPEQDAAASRVFELVCLIMDDAYEIADDMAGARSNGFGAVANALNDWQSCVMAGNFHKAASAKALVLWEVSQYVQRS